MEAAPLPDNEDERLAELLSYDVLDTEAEQLFDDLTTLASQICDTPIALISLIDPDRQWFKSRVGLDAEETSREIAFCSQAMQLVRFAPLIASPVNSQRAKKRRYKR